MGFWNSLQRARLRAKPQTTKGKMSSFALGGPDPLSLDPQLVDHAPKRSPTRFPSCILVGPWVTFSKVDVQILTILSILPLISSIPITHRSFMILHLTLFKSESFYLHLVIFLLSVIVQYGTGYTKTWTTEVTSAAFFGGAEIIKDQGGKDLVDPKSAVFRAAGVRISIAKCSPRKLYQLSS